MSSDHSLASPHFRDEETEDPRGEATCPRSHTGPLSSTSGQQGALSKRNGTWKAPLSLIRSRASSHVTTQGWAWGTDSNKGRPSPHSQGQRFITSERNLCAFCVHYNPKEPVSTIALKGGTANLFFERPEVNFRNKRKARTRKGELRLLTGGACSSGEREGHRH